MAAPIPFWKPVANPGSARHTSAFYGAPPTTMASIARAVAAATASSAALVVTVRSVRRVSTPPIRPARSAEHARQAPLREFYGTAATSSRHPPHVCNAAGFNSRRLRSSQELVGDGNAEDDEDYDPYVHGGRPNRSAIKRLIDEYKSLTKELCALPKTSVAKIQMPDELREEVYAAISITSNIARKRAEGRVTKTLRQLSDEEVLPIQTAVENIQNGIGLITVTPEVESTAHMWRSALLNGDKNVQSMVFGVLQEREDWTFTRQELGQLATTARREREEAEAEREGFKKAREEAEAAAVIMPDGTAVPSAKGPVQVQPKRKKSGAGKATKKLLKHLRKIAEVAHDAGLM